MVLLVFKAQEPNIELYTEVAAAIQNAIQYYSAIYDEKKKIFKLLPRHHWIIFSRG